MDIKDQTLATQPTCSDRANVDGASGGGVPMAEAADGPRKAPENLVEFNQISRDNISLDKLDVGVHSHTTSPNTLAVGMSPTTRPPQSGTRSGVFQQPVGGIQQGTSIYENRGGPGYSLLVPGPVGGSDDMYSLGAIQKTFQCFNFTSASNKRKGKEINVLFDSK